MFEWAHRNALQTWWLRERRDVLFGLVGLAVLAAIYLSMNLAYRVFGVLSFTQYMYFLFGNLSFLFCLVILTAKKKYILLIFVPAFLLLDIVARFIYTFAEVIPGTPYMHLEMLPVVSVFIVRLLFLLPVAALYCLRPRFKPALYWVLAFFISLAAFFQTAVFVPPLLHENFCSHRVRHIEGCILRAIALADDATFLLDPSFGMKEASPAPARIVRQDGEEIVLDGWEECEGLIGFTRHSDGPGFRVVLAPVYEESETVQVRMVHYLDGRIVHERSYECESYLVPGVDMNCLSPAGDFVALDNGVLLDFLDPDTAFHVFEEAPEVTHSFIEWTAAPETYALYYHRAGNRVILVDPHTRAEAVVHPLMFREPLIPSMTLSPNGQRLLYAGKYTDYFFVDTLGTDTFERIRLRPTDTYMAPMRPFWIDDARFMYVSRNLRLTSIADTGISRLSQVLDFVQAAYYEPATHRVIWTTRHHENGSTIHAIEVGP